MRIPPQVSAAIIASIQSSGTATTATIAEVQKVVAPVSSSGENSPGLAPSEYVTPNMPSAPFTVLSSPASSSGGGSEFMGEVPNPVPDLTDWTASEAGTSITSSYDYLRSQVEQVFTHLEGNLGEISTSALDTGTLIDVGEVSAGVTGALVGLPEMLLGGGLMIGLGIFGWLETWIAQWIPDPSIMGYHPLGFLKAGISSGGKDLEHMALDSGKVLINFFISPVRQLVGLFQRTTNAVSHAHNKIATVVVDNIPSAIRQATDHAEHYALVQVHNIEGQVSGAVDRLTSLPSVAMAKALISDAHRYGGIGWDVTATAAGAIVASTDYADQLARRAATDLANATKTVAHDAQVALDTVHNELVNQLAGDEKLLSTLATTVNLTLPAELIAKIAAATTSDNAKITSTASKLQGEINTLNSEVATLTQRINTDEANIAAAEARITTLSVATGDNTAAISTERQIIATAQSDILTNITTIHDLNTKITGISTTLAPIHAAQQLNISQLAPFENVGSVALPAVLATLSGTLNNLKTKVDTCTVDTCDPQSPQNIKNVLKGLLESILAAAEIGFIAEAIRDPLGTANALSPLLESIDNQATSTFDSLMGLL